MDFPSQYENLELVFEGETKAFRARESATQRQVLLHQLSSNPRSGRQLHLLAQALCYTSAPRAEGRSAILGIEEQGDFVWVITDDAPDLLNLWAWMECQSPKTSAPRAAPGSPVQSQTSTEALSPTPMGGETPAALDEKTAIFATRLGSAGALPVIDLESPAAEERTQTFMQCPPGRPAGEVTAVVEKGPAQPAATPQAPAQPAAASAIDPAAKPGEFTMLFRKQPGVASAGDQKPRFMGYTAPAQENTRFIDANRTTSVQPPRPEVEARTVQMPAPSAPQSREAYSGGEFTTVFGRSERDAADAELQASDFAVVNSPLDDGDAPPPGEFTQVFDARPPSSRLGSEEGASDEPGAFTRIFQIPVGSDLLTAAEPKTVRTVSPGAAQPVAWQPKASPATPTPSAAPASPLPVSPPAAKPGGTPMEIKLPPTPQIPRAPQMPQAPKLPLAGGSGAAAPKMPQFSPPKLPSVAAPKLPKVPGIEKPEGLPGPSVLPLILVFGGIVLVAVLLVLFFVMKH